MQMYYTITVMRYVQLVIQQLLFRVSEIAARGLTGIGFDRNMGIQFIPVWVILVFSHVVQMSEGVDITKDMINNKCID